MSYLQSISETAKLNIQTKGGERLFKFLKKKGEKEEIEDKPCEVKEVFDVKTKLKDGTYFQSDQGIDEDKAREFYNDLVGQMKSKSSVIIGSNWILPKDMVLFIMIERIKKDC